MIGEPEQLRGLLWDIVGGLERLAWHCWHLTRRNFGVTCLGLGLLGALLPLVPSWPFALLAVFLLGRRDPWLRFTVISGRRLR
jgi:hypothetical protein